MTAHGFATVLFGVLGVYLMGQTIADASLVAVYATSDSATEWLAETNHQQALSTALWAVLKFVLGLACFVFRDRLGARVAQPADTSLPEATEYSALQSTLFAVVGLYFGIKGATTILGGVAHIPKGKVSYTYGLIMQARPRSLRLESPCSWGPAVSQTSGLWHEKPDVRIHRGPPSNKSLKLPPARLELIRLGEAPGGQRLGILRPTLVAAGAA